MTELRLLAAALLFAASVLASACAAEQEEPELGTAEVDRGAVAMYAPGPMGGDDMTLDGDAGDMFMRTSYEDNPGRGHTHFRIYTWDGGVWLEVHLQTLCTDGNWVETRKEGYVRPNYWMFVDLDCPSPYSVSEAWASVALDY